MLVSQKQPFSERGPHWSNKAVILVKQNLYRSLPGTCMSSSAGIGVICWWYWSKRTFILVKKNIFLCPPAACILSLGGCPLLLRSTLIKKNSFINQKNIFMCPPRPATSDDVPIPVHARSQGHRPGCWTPSDRLDSPTCPCS